MATIFDNAIAAYDDSINDLRQMTNIISKVYSDYNPRITLNQFDILLQYSLLQIALADGYLDSHEVYFIRDITQYSDFCNFLNQHGFDDVTWDDIYHARESTLNRLLDDAQEDVAALSVDFIRIFSMIDAATEYDFLADLKKNVLTIIVATCQADGHAEASELNNGCLIMGAIHAIEDEKKKLSKK